MDFRDHVESELKDATRYRDFAPTGFDRAGAFLEDRQDWIVCPVSITRDTCKGDYPYSNYKVLGTWLDEVDPNGEGHEAHGFNHWGPGWFEIILVDPTHLACALVFTQAVLSLADYPILDDCDSIKRELEAHTEQECGEYCSRCEYERSELIPLLTELEDGLQPVDCIYDPEVDSYFQEALNVAARFIDQAAARGYRPDCTHGEDK